jgi:hypothetical protein
VALVAMSRKITSILEVIGGTGGNVSENDEVAFQGFSSDQ